MQTLSLATGVAFARLLEQRGRAYPGLANEVAGLANHARRQLALTNDMISSTMMCGECFTSPAGRVPLRSTR